MERLYNAGVIPVVVLEKAEDAIPTARALLAGGVDVMEITFRTAAALESIKAVSAACPDMLVGAGTVINADQCQKAIDGGAQFIVSPGFDAGLVNLCQHSGIPSCPGCVTPTEIMAAKAMGLGVLKFFPADVYGGLGAMKSLAGPFGDVKFIPTGGVNAQNLSEYIAAPYVYAVGGSWLCDKKDIAAGDFEKITALCKKARQIILGFEIAHVGLNAQDAGASMDVCEALQTAFGFDVRLGNSSNFAGSGIEVMKMPYLGEKGHIAIYTNSVPRAMACLKSRGFDFLEDSAKYKGNTIAAIYLKDTFGGFAVHLLQK